MLIPIDRWIQLLDLIKKEKISGRIALEVLTVAVAEDKWPAKVIDELCLWHAIEDQERDSYQR